MPIYYWTGLRHHGWKPSTFHDNLREGGSYSQEPEHTQDFVSTGEPARERAAVYSVVLPILRMNQRGTGQKSHKEAVGPRLKPCLAQLSSSLRSPVAMVTTGLAPVDSTEQPGLQKGEEDGKKGDGRGPRGHNASCTIRLFCPGNQPRALDRRARAHLKSVSISTTNKGVGGKMLITNQNGTQ